MEMTLFDAISGEEFNEYKQTASNDWDWALADGYTETKNGINVFSCFACGGGSTMGYKLAGCNVVGCLEIDPKINAVYVKNHHPIHNYLMDIREFNKMNNKDIPQELFNLDILDGSPPCTTFSMAGLREDSWGVEKKFREGQAKQTLDDLSFIFIETVKKLKPRVVIMENVEGLIRGEAWKYVQRIYRGFADAGYMLHHWLLKGEKMGVPQRRHRVIFVGIRNDINIDPKDLDMSFNYEPVPYGKIKTENGKTLTDGTVFKTLLLQANEKDKSLCDVSLRIGTGEKLFNKMIARRDEVLPTLTAACLTSQDIFDYESKTLISANSVIKGSSFPRDFNFLNINPGYICGMSVPPLMIKRVVTRLIESGVFDYKNKS